MRPPANSKTSEEPGIVASELIGKSLVSVMGANRAEALRRANERAADKGQPLTEWRTENSKVGRRAVKSDHILLGSEGKNISGILMILENITELVEEWKLLAGSCVNWCKPALP
jgi:hypothetical protein